jgi:GNAT superfamily N-acetyltransferase
MTTQLIRKANKRDRAAIRTLLESEARKNVHGNFLCNWKVIEDADVLLVCFDGGQLAGYFAEPFRGGILQVFQDKRGNGIGRALVEAAIDRVLDDEPVLMVQCAPSTSVPFWGRMGFAPVPASAELGGTVYMWRTIRKKFSAPPSGAVPAQVVIRWYPESRQWDNAAQPVACFSVAAWIDDTGAAHLTERVAQLRYYQGVGQTSDLVVEIEVNGHVLYCDKAKYPKAKALGVVQCRGGFYLDVVMLKTLKTPTI